MYMFTVITQITLLALSPLNIISIRFVDKFRPQSLSGHNSTNLFKDFALLYGTLELLALFIISGLTNISGPNFARSQNKF